MKNILLFFCLLLVGVTHAQNYDWALNVGGTSNDIGYSIATSASGNVYITGSFKDTVDFDPGPGTAMLASKGNGDIFFAKYDINGNYLWAKSIGGLYNDESYSIAIDASENVHITGNFRSIADFDPGPGIFNINAGGSYDIFYAKYDSSGNFLWVRRIGGDGYDVSYGLTTDAVGNVYITGKFQLTVDFDPSASTANLLATAVNNVFYAKYDSSGNYLWANSILGGPNSGSSIATDEWGNVYVTGYFGFTADFDPSGNTANITSKGSTDAFVAKYDSVGNYLWAFSVGGTGSDKGYDVVTDPSGNGDIYFTGRFSSTADFDPFGATANLNSTGDYDFFIAKYDSAGNYIWALNAGGIGTNNGYSVAVDPAGSGDVYVTGDFMNIADFDPSTGTSNLTSEGGTDIFYAKYDTDGNYLWAKSVGSSATMDQGQAIATDLVGNVYITGRFNGTADFDPDTSVANLTPIGYMDIFLAKYSKPPVGINQLLLANHQINIYPNPTEGKFRVTSLEFGVETIQIFDLFGRLVLRTNEPEIDMSNYPAGIYIWQVGEARGKLVKE